MEDLIYDRKEADIVNDTAKGQYNYEDFNRIESWCKYLSDSFNVNGYTLSIITKTNWSVDSYVTYEDMERIRKNVETLKEAFFCYTQIPENLKRMTWQKANEIERILYELDYFIKCMENNFVYAGVCGAGQNRVWQQRFRRKYTYTIEYVWVQVRAVYWREYSDNTSWEEVGWRCERHRIIN